MIEHTRLSELLFYNSFACKKFIQISLGLSLYKVNKQLPETDGVVQISIPTASRPYRKQVFALDEPGQVKAVGKTRDPEELCAAAMMGFSRLNIFRLVVFPEIAHQYTVNWVISPWKVPNSGIFCDGLMSVAVDEHSAYLLVVVISSELQDLRCHTKLARAWEAWRKKTEFLFPAVLLFWDVQDVGLVSDLIDEYRVKGNGGVILRSPGGSPGVDSRFYSPITPVFPKKLLQISFLSKLRSTRRRGARQGLSAIEWSRKESRLVGEAASHFSHITANYVKLLLAVATHPGLTKKQHKTFLSSTRMKKKTNKILEDLLRCDLVQGVSLKRGQKNYLLTAKGLQILAGIYGLPLDQANQNYGYPVRKDMFLGQRQHLTGISSIFTDWQRAGILLTWRSSYTPMDLLGSEHHHKRYGYQNIRIVPDAVGAFLLCSAPVFFWFELDRGTKWDEKIENQLEKYIKAGVSAQSNRIIPLVLFMVSDHRGYHQSRLAWLLEIVCGLLAKHPNSKTRMAFTTLEGHKHAQQGEYIKAPIWTVVLDGRIQVHPQSLFWAAKVEKGLN